MASASEKVIIIIGGGVGGCCTALQFAKNGKHKLFIFEKNSELMRGSSDVTPGRMGLGFHYADTKTALYYLHATLEFTKRYGTFRQDIDRSPWHPLRRGRYFIMKDSLVSKSDIIETYDALKEEYTRIVEADQSYQLFGPPETFYRILETHEFQTEVPTQNIEVGIETAEELLNWPKFRDHVINELKCYENCISVKLDTEVTHIQSCTKNGYFVDFKAKDNNTTITTTTYADVIVNASWYNITQFNEMIGVTDVKRCNRVKAIATIKLPRELVDAPSMFFCFGNFGSFCNKGNGIAMITFGAESNVASSTSGQFEEEMSSVCFHISKQARADKGRQLIKGISQFIPLMHKAVLIKTDYGIVQTLMDENTIERGFQIGDLDAIHDPKSGGIFKRDYSGVKVVRPGYVINACMKLIYCFQNAEQVRTIVDSYINC